MIITIIRSERGEVVSSTHLLLNNIIPARRRECSFHHYSHNHWNQTNLNIIYPRSHPKSFEILFSGCSVFSEPKTNILSHHWTLWACIERRHEWLVIELEAPCLSQIVFCSSAKCSQVLASLPPQLQFNLDLVILLYYFIKIIKYITIIKTWFFFLFLFKNLFYFKYSRCTWISPKVD